MREMNETKVPPTTVAAIASIIGALLLIIAFFLPYAAARDEYRADLLAYPDLILDKELGLSNADVVDLSLFEYASIYAGQTESAFGPIAVIYLAVIGAAALTALLALLFALLRKATPAAIFAMLNMSTVLLLNWDFEDRGMLPNTTYDWGIAKWVYLISAILVIASAIWLFILKHRAKATAAAERTTNA